MTEPSEPNVAVAAVALPLVSVATKSWLAVPAVGQDPAREMSPDEAAL